MTRTPLSRSKGQRVKGQGHQAALLSAALTRKVAAAVSVGTYSAWENTATLRLLGGARGARVPTGGGERRGHIVSPCTQLVLEKKFPLDSGPLQMVLRALNTALRQDDGNCKDRKLYRVLAMKRIGS